MLKDFIDQLENLYTELKGLTQKIFQNYDKFQVESGCQLSKHISFLKRDDMLSKSRQLTVEILMYQ